MTSRTMPAGRVPAIDVVPGHEVVARAALTEPPVPKEASADAEPLAPDATSLGVGRGASPASRWAPRRIVAALVLAPVFTAVLFATAGWDPAGAPLWTVLSLATAAAAAVAVASFVPLRGQRLVPDVGCGSCSLAGGLMPLAAMWLIASTPLDGGTAAMALSLAGAGLTQRLTQPATCETAP